MIVLSFLFIMSKKHKVVNLNIDVYDAHVNSASSDCNDELISNKEEITMKDDLIGNKLFKTMEEEKLFLNPELSLREVSAAIGSNMKYLSLYLNRNLGTSFYEYVNKFRVEEACVLIQRMERDGRRNMQAGMDRKAVHIPEVLFHGKQEGYEQIKDMRLPEEFGAFGTYPYQKKDEDHSSDLPCVSVIIPSKLLR